MPGPNADFSVILRGRFPGKDRAVAQAIARAFARDEAWGLQVVGAAPITVLAGLTVAQAQAALAALVEVEHAGCRFQSQQGLDKSCPSIQWPTPPRLLGRTIDELSGSGVHAQTAPASASEVSASCPHCGKTIQIRLTPQTVQFQMNPWPSAGPAGAPAPKVMLPIPIPVPVAAAAKAPPAVPAPVAAAGIMNQQIPIPGHAAPRSAMPPVQVGRPHQSGHALPSPALEPFQGSELEELVPIQDAPPAPPLRGRPGGPRVSGGVPLPEVPIVEPKHPGGLPPSPREMLPVTAMDPRMSGPMAMEDFEAGLAKKMPGNPPPASIEVPIQASGNGDSNAALQRLAEEDPDATCSIFIGKSNNPRVHDLVAEIQGITAKEAQKLCQKPVVPIVKDIPVSEAKSIKQRFQEINVNPRVTMRR